MTADERWDPLEALWRYRQSRFRDPAVYRHLILQDIKSNKMLPWPVRLVAGFFWWWL